MKRRDQEKNIMGKMDEEIDKVLLKLFAEWGKECSRCGWTGELEEEVEIFTDYVSVTISCPKCGFSKFNHIDESYWIQ